MRSKLLVSTATALLIGVLGGCSSVGQKVSRRGDEIMVAGQMFHTGAPVVLWTDPGGFDAYRTERRFTPYAKADYFATTQETKMSKDKVHNPARLDLRDAYLTPEEIQQVRGGGWPLDLLQQKVDQFVYHYDVASTSSQCFSTLHDGRGLSVHFMLDIDGTIYQSCDVKERTWHATKSNARSVGVEIANIGAYEPNDPKHTLSTWYRKDPNGRTRIVLPRYVIKQPLRTPNFVGYPARSEPVVGEIQGRKLEMYDLTPQQYDSLIKLTATLCTALPKITCDYPRDADGKLITHALSDQQWTEYQGLMGHFHVQTDKIDPGPAVDFDKIRAGAWKLMSRAARKANDAARGKPVKRSTTQALAEREFPQNPYPSVRYEHLETTDPQHQVFIAQIDLTDKHVRIRVAPSGPDPDGPGEWETVLTPPTKVAEREGFDVVINGDFFSHLNGKDAEGEAAQKMFAKGAPAKVSGPAMSDGKLWGPAKKPRAAFIVSRDGKVSIAEIQDPPADAVEVIAGSDIIVQKSANVAPKGKGFPDTTHPRTAVGIADGGKRLVLVVADGRRKDRVGYALSDLADLMIKLGCEDVVNLDGGGSSVLGIRDPKTGKMEVMNSPSDGQERAVANVLGVTVTTKAKD